MTNSFQARLRKAKASQDTYRPSENTARRLKEVTFVALIGISGIGKSHLIPHIIEQGGADFSEVGNISTRATRSSDPINFRGGRSHEELLERIEQRELINYIVHPSGEIYATDPGSYQSKFVLLPTLTSALPQLASLGCFKEIVPVSLIVDGATWEERFKEKHSDPKVAARLNEALVCLRWIKEHASSVPILVNRTGEGVTTARKIIDILRGHKFQSESDTLNLLSNLEQAVKRQQEQLGSV